MNSSKKKMNNAFAWAAFLASYILVSLMISMPMQRQPTEEPSSEAVFARLAVDN